MAYFIPKNTETVSFDSTKIKRIFSAVLGFLILFGGTLYVFRLDASDFQKVTEENVERLHAEIQAEKYREIFLNNDRRLIVETDEAELTLMLKQARYFLAENPQINCLPPRFEDSLERVNQRFGKPFAFYNLCFLTTESGAAATELFVWKNSGGSLKLAYYEFAVR